MKQGRILSKADKPSEYVSPYIQGDDVVSLHAWLTKCDHILRTIFGEDSSHFEAFKSIEDRKYLERGYMILPLIGIVSAAADDLENGYLINQEILIAGEVFDTVLAQAEHLLSSGYKDPAAMLGRVVIEDSLKRIARENGIETDKKTSMINDELKRIGRLTQPQWRQIQFWIDIGNHAAHGEFDKYDTALVQEMLTGISRFLAAEFHA